MAVLNLTLALFAVLIALAMVAVGFANRKEELPFEPMAEGAQANLANRGLVIARDGWVYYADPASNYQVKRLSEADGHLEHLSGVRGMYLSADDEYLYYVDATSEKLSRVRLSGNEITWLTEETVSFAMLIEDRLIYAALDGGVYSIRKDGTRKDQLSTVRTQQLIALSDKLYYGDLDRENAAGRMDRKSGENPESFDWRLGQGAVPVKESLYYIDTQGDHRLYRVDFSDPNAPEVMGEDIGVVNGMIADGDRLYYIKPENGGRLYCRQGRSDDELTDFPVNSPQLVGEWIYLSRADEDGALYRMNKRIGEPEKLP